MWQTGDCRSLSAKEWDGSRLEVPFEGSIIVPFFASGTLTKECSTIETMRKEQFQGWQVVAVTFCLSSKHGGAYCPHPSKCWACWGLQGKTQCLIRKESAVLSQLMEKGRYYPTGVTSVLKCLKIIGQYCELQSCKQWNVTKFLFPWGKLAWSPEHLAINKRRGGIVPQ